MGWGGRHTAPRVTLGLGLLGLCTLLGISLSSQQNRYCPFVGIWGSETCHTLLQVTQRVSTRSGGSPPALLFPRGHCVPEVELAWKWGSRSSLGQAGPQQPLSPERQDEEALRIPGPRPGSKHVPAATSLWTCFPICKMGLLFKL